MITITCDCPTCEINAAKVGASFPLKAEVSAKLANSIKGKSAHGLVYDAHNPGPIGQAVRKATGIRPLA